MYNDGDDDDDDGSMTSMPCLVHRQRQRAREREEKQIRYFFSLPCSIFLSLVVTIHSFDDASQCVDARKYDDAATIITVSAVATSGLVAFAVLRPNRDSIQTYQKD